MTTPTRRLVHSFYERISDLDKEYCASEGNYFFNVRPTRSEQKCGAGELCNNKGIVTFCIKLPKLTESYNMSACKCCAESRFESLETIYSASDIFFEPKAIVEIQKRLTEIMK